MYTEIFQIYILSINNIIWNGLYFIPYNLRCVENFLQGSIFESHFPSWISKRTPLNWSYELLQYGNQLYELYDFLYPIHSSSIII